MGYRAQGGTVRKLIRTGNGARSKVEDSRNRVILGFVQQSRPLIGDSDIVGDILLPMFVKNS